MSSEVSRGASSGGNGEIILAEEQGVLCRRAGAGEEIEATFGVGDEVEGTLVLTNKKLLFVAGRGETVESLGELGFGKIAFSDIEDLRVVVLPSDPNNLSIPFSSIASVSGHKGLRLPSLTVNWKDASGAEKARVFHQRITDRARKRNLNDWAKVIERLKSGQQKIVPVPRAPSKDTLEGKILYVLGDMQDKGSLQIENEVEKQFGSDVNPDEVEWACEKLASMGLLDRLGDPNDNFYRRRSPLGEDDLSS